MSELPHSFSFVDVETTGTSPTADRIIEIGIIRVEKYKIVDSFESLIDPQKYLDPVITKITGITQRDLLAAPTFEETLGKVKELISGSVFVAHNARFDYAFLKNEFFRFGNHFSAKTLCTVKL